MMGSYYNPQKVKEEATPIFIQADKPIGLPLNHRRIAVLDNGLREIAVDVTEPGEWAEFHGQYSRGLWLTCKVYAYPEDKRGELR
jgi:hypothetical protein